MVREVAYSLVLTISPIVFTSLAFEINYSLEKRKFHLTEVELDGITVNDLSVEVALDVIMFSVLGASHNG